jgi:hypothetical protein
MPDTIDNLGKDPWENYWRHIRVKSLELALREAEVSGKPLEGKELFERANEVFSYLASHTGPDDD